MIDKMIHVANNTPTNGFVATQRNSELLYFIMTDCCLEKGAVR